jgi:hypothetical protein
MKNILTKKRIMLTMVASIVSVASPAGAAEKLKIFILAGQSNTVGHANPHTVATLYQSGNARDEALARLVFKEGSGLSKEALGEQLAQARKLDELSGGISFDKVKKMEDGPEKKGSGSSTEDAQGRARGL